MKNLRTYKGPFSRTLTSFGDLLSMEHCSLYDHGTQYALNGNVIALVIRDVHAFLGAVYPASSKCTAITAETRQRVIGDSKIKRLYSDNADELIVASRDIGIPHEASQQGMLETNGIIEREVQGLLTGVRAIMFAVGMPGYFWSRGSPVLHASR